MTDYRITLPNDTVVEAPSKQDAIDMAHELQDAHSTSYRLDPPEDYPTPTTDNSDTNQTPLTDKEKERIARYITNNHPRHNYD